MTEPRRITITDHGDAIGIDRGDIASVDAALLLEEAAGILLDYPDITFGDEDEPLVGLPPF